MDSREDRAPVWVFPCVFLRVEAPIVTSTYSVTYFVVPGPSRVGCDWMYPSLVPHRLCCDWT